VSKRSSERSLLLSLLQGKWGKSFMLRRVVGSVLLFTAFALFEAAMTEAGRDPILALATAPTDFALLVSGSRAGSLRALYYAGVSLYAFGNAFIWWPALRRAWQENVE
jgi:hypothetical protein